MPVLAAATDDPDAPASAALRRIRWRARRGLLENDLVLGRYFARHPDGLDGTAAAALAQLLELADGDLLDLVLGRAQPDGALDSAPVRAVLEELRAC